MKLYIAKIVLFVFLLSEASSCQKFDECEGIICFTPPRRFYLEVVDEAQGENLYSTDNLQVENLSFKNENSEDVEVTFVKENGRTLINISAIGLMMGEHTYYLKLSNDIEIVIDIEMQEKNEDCCTFFEVEKFEIRDYDFEISQYSEIIKIEI